MTPRTWAYGGVPGDDEPIRDPSYESFGQQGLALPTYAHGPDRGAERVLLGEAVARRVPTGPKSWQRRDERIHEDVRVHLTTDGHVDASHLEVVVHQGDVALSGTVPDRAQRERAIRIAESVRGVIAVVGQIRVRDAHRL